MGREGGEEEEEEKEAEAEEEKEKKKMKKKKKMEKEKETEKKKKKQGEKEVFQFYIYKLPIDRPAAVTGNTLILLSSYPFWHGNITRFTARNVVARC